ncbi:acyl-CoA dehydrogenase family protein [Variovorax sp. Sphag1AA]|uniref:acyl-CoA dehydrogenase family protein n=1 Tax=Variovorax sp. Sphag1AA TaxID=2587027 RepID=UPI0016125DB4|nr:acyl-CoA dehydrogenase family protein [Variovorax sp. Sphag1AA]MBB3181424.1 acyl-CoA dehydrogenase [Variovorax sp. Sphag1AA]
MTATSDLSDFRRRVRDFVQEHLPPDIRDSVRRGQQLSRERTVAWNEILARHGYLVPHWPREWGGQGWTVSQQLAFDEEMCTHDAPELNSVTFDMIGPVLVRYGTDAQRDRFLPAIASGRQWWCQGYSEPNAGSDLASLATRAERHGDRYVVTGSKIWTSYAQYADWMFCLVRTDTQAKPQEGISFLLIDMKSPGITVRPIVGIHGWVVFNEVFLDAVEVPVANLVGEEHRGWGIAKSLLEFERLKLARVGENKRRRARARAVAMERHVDGRRIADHGWFRERFAELDMRLMALEANAARFIARSQAGEPIGAEVSMLKLRGSQLIQRWEELTVDALGEDALPLDPAALDGSGRAEGLAAIALTASSRRFLSRGYTIAGGSSEIQHNILAKQVLGL